MSYSITFGDAPMRVWKAGADYGDTAGDYYFCGVLATTTRDRQGEAFTHRALQGIADFIQAHPLDVVGDNHNPGIESAFGRIHNAEYRLRDDGTGELYVEGHLFGDDPFAGRVHRQMAEGLVHLSIGGRLPSPQAAFRAFPGGVETRFLDEVEPLHALACRKGVAVNKETWTMPIAKALADGEEMKPTAADAESETATDMSETAPADPAAEQAPEADDFAAVAEELYGLLEALQETVTAICEATDVDRVGLLTQELANFEASALAALGAESSEPEATPVSEGEAETAQEEIIAKAIGPIRATLDELKLLLAAKDAEIAKARTEVETLKSAPAAGGPEGKASGDASRVLPRNPEADLAQAASEAAEAHDAKTYHRLQATRLLSGR